MCVCVCAATTQAFYCPMGTNYLFLHENLLDIRAFNIDVDCNLAQHLFFPAATLLQYLAILTSSLPLPPVQYRLIAAVKTTDNLTPGTIRFEISP